MKESEVQDSINFSMKRVLDTGSLNNDDYRRNVD